MRNALTRNPGAVVETNSGNDCPVSTLAAPAYPMIALAAPRWRISQCGSPGSEFSATARRRGRGVGVLTGRAGATAGLPLHADVTAIAAPATPNTPRPRNVRLLAPPGGAEPLGTSPSRVMADRMHPPAPSTQVTQVPQRNTTDRSAKQPRLRREVAMSPWRWLPAVGVP